MEIIKDNYPKYVTTTDFLLQKRNGIYHINLIDFMKEGKADMDKRKEENIRVKKSITEALLKLMHEKSFSDISITEIIRSAKVARASFYRNYDFK